MAEDINRTIIVGRLTRPAEKVSTASGVDLVKFSIASNRRKKKDEQWIDEAHYFDFIYWGKRAAGIHPYLGKGQQVAVEGRLIQNRWEQDGQKRSKVEIEVISVQLMGGRPEGSNTGQAQPSQGGFHNQQNPTPGNNQQPPQSNFEDDTIPF